MTIIKKQLSYLKENYLFILISIGIFLFFSIVGFIFPFFKEEIFEIFNELTKMFKGLNFFQTFLLIFFNNARTSLTGLVFGIFAGIFPLIILMANGYIIGVISKIVSSERSFFELIKLLPHGIFELPAVFISMALGLKIGFVFLSEISFKKAVLELERALKIFVLIILPLLIIAAIIETFLIFFLSS